MAVRDIVRWLREERGGLQELTDRLRERAAKPPRGGRDAWITELRTRFDEFATHVGQRMTQQEAGGYLKPVLEARPALAGQIDLLKLEHAELSRIMESVQRAVHRLTPQDNLLLRDCCKRIEDLLAWVDRHEEHENHLVLYVLAEETAAQR